MIYVKLRRTLLRQRQRAGVISHIEWLEASGRFQIPNLPLAAIPCNTDDYP